MNIALLGVSGFVGQNIFFEFQNFGFNIFPVSLKYGYDLRTKEDNIRFIKDSKCDIIINCAAHVGTLKYVTDNAGTIISDNAKMSLFLYESIQEINHNIIVINPIANCAFPASATIYKEDELLDGPLHPSIIAYGLSRRFLIGTSECYCLQYGIRTINLLVPNMYGPFDSTDLGKAHALNALIGKFVKASEEKREEIEVWGTGNVIREWLYVKDLARLLLLIVKNIDSYKELNTPVNIAQNWGVSIRELVELMAKEFEYKGKINWNSSMPDGTLKKVMDNTLFKRIFLDFTFTPFEQGIKETTNYYLSKYPY